jgi:hypothetical protein
LKEQIIDNENNGNMKPQQPSKGIVWDPKDVAKTTMKEQTIDNDYDGIVSVDVPAMPVHDPNDIAKVTTRQTTQLMDYLTPANASEEGKVQGYMNALETTIAPVTQRQDTSVEYQGNAYSEREGGYTIANMEDKNTNRQFTSDYEYSGIAGPKGQISAPMSHEEYDNSTVRSLRQDVSMGRAPVLSGPKNALGGDQIYATTKKMGELQNVALAERAVVPTAITNSLPQVEPWQVTKDKTTVPNQPIENRLDPNLLNAFRNNPYTQPLDSYIFP